jgi:predicted transcriptional regulator
MTVGEVADATGRERSSVYTSLTAAVAAGRAERVGRGVYRAAGG